MKVEFAFLCRKAKRINSESIDASGIGTRRYLSVPSAVSESNVCNVEMNMVVLLKAEHIEAGKYLLTLTVEDTKGYLTLGPGQEIEFRKSAPGQPSYASVIFDLEVPIRIVGRHMISVRVNGVTLHSLEFTTQAPAN